MNDRYLIIGPLPPAIGGIATIVGTLKNEFEGDPKTVFLDTAKFTEGSSGYMRPLKSLVQVVTAALQTRNGAVFMFSSAQASFWEKCLWCLIFKIFGWRTVVQMVDGNFPRFHEEMSGPVKWLASILMKNVDTLAAQSPRWRAFYEEAFPGTAVKVVSPGVDTEFFCPPSERTPREYVEISYIGWLIEPKGIYDLIDAARILKHNGSKFKLKLVGPAFGTEQKLFAYVQAHELTDSIDIQGPITSREMVRAAYQSADIFVFPSHFEGFPYALMEAVSSGLPCVGTRVGGIPDILDNGVCGLLTEKESPKELAEALSRLIDDAEYRRALGHRARERATREYSLHKSVDDFRFVLDMERTI